MIDDIYRAHSAGQPVQPRHISFTAARRAGLERAVELDADDAIALGQTGPNLRASGVDWDLRRDGKPVILFLGRFDPRNGLATALTWMVGNSPKSDINPALAAGLNAVFVPHDNTWILEHEELAAARALADQRRTVGMGGGVHA